MSDIARLCEELRYPTDPARGHGPPQKCADAADTIERLERENAALRENLEILHDAMRLGGASAFPDDPARDVRARLWQIIQHPNAVFNVAAAEGPTIAEIAHEALRVSETPTNCGGLREAAIQVLDGASELLPSGCRLVGDSVLERLRVALHTENTNCREKPMPGLLTIRLGEALGDLLRRYEDGFGHAVYTDYLVWRDADQISPTARGPENG